MKNYLILALVVVGCSVEPSVDGGTGGGRATGGGTGAGGGIATGGDGGGGPTGLAVDQFCAAKAEAACAFAIRCGSAATGADCQKVNSPSRFSLSTARANCLPATLDAGHLVYDGVAAQACVDAVAATAPCNPVLYLASVPSCLAVIHGTRSQGATCGDLECADGLYCDSTVDRCPGVCLPRVQAGGAASNPASCMPGAYYTSTPDGGMCLAPANPGERCAPVPGAALSPLCLGANTCQLQLDGGAVCQPYKVAGQACGGLFDFACAMGTTCMPGGDGGTQCVPLGKRNDPCVTGGQCQAGLSCSGGACDSLLAAGVSCSGDSDCAAGLLCIGQRCRAPNGVGADCDTAPFQDDCAQDLFCNASGRCEVRRGVGAECQTSRECASDLSCATNGGVSRCGTQVCRVP